MKINDLTNNSLFTELSSDEAAKVNGGSGFTYSSYYLSLHPNKFRLKDTLANGVNQKSLGAFDRRLRGILAPLRYNGIRI